MKLLYIAGPYSASTREGIEENIKAAQLLGAAVMRALPGCLAVVPHNLGAGLEEQGDYKFWCEATLAVLRKCDGVVLLCNWTQSPGAIAEVNEALKLGLPVVVESLNYAADLRRTFGGAA